MRSMKLAPATQPEDMSLRREWTGDLFDDPTRLPISFRYGDTTIRGIPADWNTTTTSRRIDANLVETAFEGADSTTDLVVRVEMLAYLDFPVVEWFASLSNRGNNATPIVTDLRVLDAEFSGDGPVLWHCNGDFYSEEGYTPVETPLPPGTSVTFAPNGGRPSDGAFPYYRVRFADRGLSLAIGWPAQWSVDFTGADGGVSIRAGQESLHSRLLPGETIRSPRITLLAWNGDMERSIHLWRRWYRAHILPRPDGRPLTPLLACAATEDGEEFTAATEENQLRFIDDFRQAGIDFDIWWIDAGWYPCRDSDGNRRWPRTGTWRPDPERFPSGLRPISERASETGARLLIWFEPERVTRDSELDRKPSEWLLRGDENDFNALLNLGNPDCREWLTDHVDRLIRENGIGVYRQDFNFPPLGYWRNGETDDRRGMNENRHVAGYLRYWDDLLARNPGLWIDSCSSGGRRNDLETMRRSVPLHYTDFGYGNHPIKLAFHRTMFEWIPYFKECTLSWDRLEPGGDTRFDTTSDAFSFHCGLAAMLFPTIDIRRLAEYDVEVVRRMIGVWRRAAPIMLEGDYTPLTPFHREGDRWVAWQFDRPEAGDGFIQGIRHAACPEESLIASLRGLAPSASYRFENPETGERKVADGATLAEEGWEFSVPPRSAELWFYQVIRDESP